MAAPSLALVRRPPIHVGSILKSSTETVIRLTAFAGHDLVHRLADIEPFEAERLRASTDKSP